MVVDIQYQEAESHVDNNNSNQSDTYWNTPQVVNKSKKVSYDDILSSLNLVVSTDGVLKKISNKNNVQSVNQLNEENPETFVSDISPRKRFEPASFKPKLKIPFKNDIKNVSYNNNTIEPQLKNSTIYNKYFNNYNDTSIDILPRRPLTQSELRVQLICDKMNYIHQRKRVSHIKSKQLLLTTNTQGPIRPRNMSYENHLFNFSKKSI
jgi:hypothetical protein